MNTKRSRACGLLEPCPFCGGQKLNVFQHSDDDGDGWLRVECLNNDCRTVGPRDKGTNGAMTRWNERSKA